jgi:hypothetical protein
MKPEFATNLDGDRVADAVAGHIQWVVDKFSQAPDIAIATAYFNPGGFGLLAEPLEAVAKVRLLLGAQPSSTERRLRHLDPASMPERAERSRVRAALTGHALDIEADRDLLGFEIEVDQSAKRLIEWLRSGNVEVRRFENGFLHGKAFLVETDDEGVIAGSSNFTYAGLAVNKELNLGHYQPSVVARVREWFDRMWTDSEPFDLAGVYAARYEPHNPYTVYLRMLWERYGKELEEEAAEAEISIRLAQFQQDGLWRARRILRSRNGVLIADGVGLGKTFLGGELIREAIQDRRQRVLLVAPASLRDGTWAAFMKRFNLYFECKSYEQLMAGEVDAKDLNEYAMVVIDEAHAFRNPDTQRAQQLREVLKGSPPKNLVLLTATPVNNSLWDLYYLLGYFIRNDATFASVGIQSLRSHFADAMAVDPDDLSPDRLFDILDEVAVRRTRHFVKRYYPNDRIHVDGKEMPITFPKPVTQKVTYDLDKVFPGFFPRFAHSLDCTKDNCDHADPAVRAAPFLSLARYMPSMYRKGAVAAEAYEAQVVGLLRSGLLKRFESSAHAFAETCDKMASNHDAFLEVLGRGFVGRSDALSDWIKTDSADFEEFLDRQSAELEPASGYDVAGLREDVVVDRDLLRAFAAEARAVRPEDDPKLKELVERLGQIAADAAAEAIGLQDERDKRKVIVFSYFEDTALWIENRLKDVLDADPRLHAFQGRLVAVSGDRGDRSDAMFGFAPVTSEAPSGKDEDRFDILVSTDVLAEGVNLQQARHVINFDLPWNPMRLVQRHGRIDRIGSSHDKVFMHCFFPDAHLDELLGLEERLMRKIKQAAAAVGVESEPLPGSKARDVVFAQTRDEIEALAREEAGLFESGGEVTAYSGEEYRQELRRAMESPTFKEMVRSLPWGSGSGMAREGARLSFIFCVRVGDYGSSLFRYVAPDSVNPDTAVAPLVVGDTLTALSAANCLEDEVRVLDDETHRRAYEAWDVARQDILADWLRSTDPVNLQPRVPRTMRDAASILREYPPPGMETDDVDRLVGAIEAPYGNRIQAMIREATRSSNDRRVQAQAIASVAKELGLQPGEAPEPLPVIALDDIHLVCWMAIVPSSID